MNRFIALTLIGATALSLSACDNKKDEPQIGKLTHHLTMVGEDGKRYGTVDLDPVGGGQVYDANGVLIGRVVAP